MGFAMNCDRCGRFMKNVAAKDLRKLPQEIVCAPCKKIEASAKATVDQMKRAARADFEKVANSYKETLTELLKMAVHGDTEES